jgi:hypothetical protein
MEKLFIATPAYGHQVFIPYVEGLVKFTSGVAPSDLEYETNIHLHAGSALVTQARNNCVTHFLRTDCTKLLFIDADIGFEPENIWRLLRKNVDVAIAPYVVKSIKTKKNLKMILHYDDPENINIGPDGFAEIKGGPSGFMMIDRSVFEKLKEAFPEKHQPLRHIVDGEIVQEKDYHTFFDCSVDPEEGCIGEDLSFCFLWKSIGGEIYCDTTANLTHCGMHQFSGSLMEQLQEK